MRKEIFSLILLMAVAGATPANDIWQSLFKEKLREATRGDSAAQYDVGSMYQNGRGVTADRDKAIEWYTKAAAQDNQKAVSRLELMRANETRFSRTEARAARGDVDNQYDLGNMYEKGIGTRINYQQARDWYEKAAAAGHAGASFNLGLMYHEGAGIGQDNKTAYAWFRDAAGKGSTPAQYYLGKLYAAGTGVNKDYAAALEWYSKAAAGGFDQARGGVIEVREKMKQPQSAQGTGKEDPATRASAASTPQKALQPAADSDKKLIAQPVVEKKPVKAVNNEHNATLMETLMLTLWSRQANPVSYLPSTINNCRTEEKRIICFSDDQTRESGGNEVKFKTKSVISDFAKDGTFKVLYRNLVITASQPDDSPPQEPEAAYGDEGTVASHTVNTGWGIEHTIDCTMKKNDSLTCVKDKSRTIEISSQQNLAHGR
ncbi:MAG: sel1 repeat family protein [Gammaproteobacteria bacterium]|nr:MAG: sel1 repeat family protein [Gammaproteobacteria bacterium]